MSKTIIDPETFGVSFSVKQCRSFRIDSSKTLRWLLQDCGFRRFRLMSYWDEIERQPGQYDYSELDRQLQQIAKFGGVVSLCLGARQPRWPENHWPQWAWESTKPERTLALLNFITETVKRYKDNAVIISYQLENEALLKQFGLRAEADRTRLRQEYDLVSALDPSKPIIMSTSTSWGIPLRKPIPNIVGFSYYQIVYNARLQRYTTAFHTPVLHKLRAASIKLLHGTPAFIHELQLEPWGPRAIWEMPAEEQDKSMGPEQINRNVQLAKKVGHFPIDLWGAEWWYWRKHTLRDESVWRAVQAAVRS